jgi:FkbM family methyltransferase
MARRSGKGDTHHLSDEQIHLLALDDFVKEQGIARDLIKIDVEGAELVALSGMKETVVRHRPAVIVEVTPKKAPEVARGLPDTEFEWE